MPTSGDNVVTRFAPSPNGWLHMGHAWSAFVGWRVAREAGGTFLLRIEDIDTTRARPEFDRGIQEDLTWLGLNWDGEVRRQSEHFADYQQALDKLQALGLLYPCFCTRKDIQQEIEDSGHALHGPEGHLYPGICKHLSVDEQQSRMAKGEAHALRLHVDKATECVPAQAGRTLAWTDELAGPQQAAPELLGDVVLARKDIPASYHLAVTVDDALQGVTLVTRGMDLFHATHMHVLLQALLGLPTPTYHHHRLIEDEGGVRLAKSKGSPALKDLRAAGEDPRKILQFLENTTTSDT